MWGVPTIYIYIYIKNILYIYIREGRVTEWKKYRYVLGGSNSNDSDTFLGKYVRNPRGVNIVYPKASPMTCIPKNST